MIDNRTTNLGYLLPNEANLMKSEDLPRFITTLTMLDEDIAEIITQMLGFAPLVHTHEMAQINGLVSALNGKSSTGHTHNFGTLGGLDLSSAASGQFLGYNGTIWIPVTIQASHLADKIISNAKMRDSAALTLFGRAANSTGSPGDIAAAANDRVMARVADVLSFVQLTAGMFADNTIAFSKFLTSDGIARLGVEDQIVTGGARVTPKDLGNLSGATLTLDPGDRPIQKVTNNGAGSLLPGTNYGVYSLVVVNATGAGAITTTGWIIDGDDFDTTVGSKFLCSCIVCADFSFMLISKVV